jgi:hypothetical protein
MDAFLNRFWWLKSKKVWAFIIGVVGITGAAFQADVFPYVDYTTKLVALIVGFQAANALEDGMKARATAAALITSVSAPAGTDVSVSAPPATLGVNPVLHSSQLPPVGIKKPVRQDDATVSTYIDPATGERKTLK